MVLRAASACLTLHFISILPPRAIPTSVSLLPATRLGRFEIEEPPGAGDSEGYRARDARLDRTIAIKILPAHLSSVSVFIDSDA
jgi:hypothetical protein